MTWGMVACAALVVVLMFGESHLGLDVPRKPWNVHAGIWGLLRNVAVVGAMSLMGRVSSPRPAPAGSPRGRQRELSSAMIRGP